MKKYLFAYYNKLGGFFGFPFAVDHKESFKDVYRQSCYGAEKKSLESMKEEEIFYLGEFDNESGVITPEKEFYLSCDSIVSEVLAKRFGGDEHVGESVKH